eukprot:TRINITY_DN5621_c0_g1_i4.p2 TRINITY_DN5621_c0_g1~~TRINITY_DN5621_c0_g1_i4.p2  ORF type:complete len:114 (+),score=34.13 TRINITY_DN5621_c0_g1_i4:345-686(+)
MVEKNTKSIFEATGAKIRLRGKGSGHIEGGRGEAPVHLMLAITTEIGMEESFVKAVEMSEKLLEAIAGKYRYFCQHRGDKAQQDQLFWVGEASQEALSCMGDVAKKAPEKHNQ